MNPIDVLVIGAGPAGVTAAIYAKRSLLDTVVLEQEAPGGQMLLTPGIENYPGFGNVAGYELAERMEAQAKDLGARFLLERASGLSLASNGLIDCILESGQRLTSRSVIIASGASARKAGFINEAQFTGHGVSYCCNLRWTVLQKQTRVRSWWGRLGCRGGSAPGEVGAIRDNGGQKDPSCRQWGSPTGGPGRAQDLGEVPGRH